MTVESHIPFGGGPEASQDDAGFEAPKSRRKSRRERRAERARTPERTPEPHTIWTREDPNHLQPLSATRPAAEKSMAQPTEQKSERKADHAPEAPKAAKPVAERRREEAPETVQQEPDNPEMLQPEAAMPAPQKREVSARKGGQPESLADLLKLQELPKLNIQRRHFYTEPEVRQPNATETEHDILPSTRQEKQPGGVTTSIERTKPTPAERQSASVSRPEDEPKQLSPTPKETQERSVSSSGETTGHDKEQTAAEVSDKSEQVHTGEQLQHIADETARRAAELASKDGRHEESGEQRATATPEVAQKPASPESGRVDENGVGFRMEQADMLDIGNSIRVEDVSITEMFRAGRLDEEGMRRIVAAFLRGHDVQRVIAEEVLRVQMRFELDPQLRKTALKRSSRSTKRAAGRSRIQAKKVLDPKRAKYQANRMADRLVGGLDRVIEVVEEKPNTAKTAGIVLAVVLYFVILILILKS